MAGRSFNIFIIGGPECSLCSFIHTDGMYKNVPNIEVQLATDDDQVD